MKDEVKTESTEKALETTKGILNDIIGLCNSGCSNSVSLRVLAEAAFSEVSKVSVPDTVCKQDTTHADSQKAKKRDDHVPAALIYDLRALLYDRTGNVMPYSNQQTIFERIAGFSYKWRTTLFPDLVKGN